MRSRSMVLWLLVAGAAAGSEGSPDKARKDLPAREGAAATLTGSPAQLHSPTIGDSFCLRNDYPGKGWPIREVIEAGSWMTLCPVKIEHVKTSEPCAGVFRVLQDNDTMRIGSDENGLLLTLNRPGQKPYALLNARPVVGKFGTSADHAPFLVATDAPNGRTFYIYIVDVPSHGASLEKHYFVEEYHKDESDECKKERPSDTTVKPFPQGGTCAGFKAWKEILETGIGDGRERRANLDGTCGDL